MTTWLRHALRRFAPARAAYRLVVLWQHRSQAGRRRRQALWYALHGRELFNFTYELENVGELVRFVSAGLDVPRARVEAYIAELRDDRELRERLAARQRTRPNREREIHYGSRQALYCVIRIRRPRVVVETGTHDGLGTAVMARAVQLNAAEGAPGRVLTFDINPESGWLLESDELAAHVDAHVGDSTALLPPALARAPAAEVFYQDSLKVAEHERLELEAVVARAAPGAVLMTDDARATRALPELAARTGARYVTFRERPAGHWWPGNEVGMCVLARPALPASPPG